MEKSLENFDLIEKALNRETKAKERAEQLLDDKARRLYLMNQSLEKKSVQLERAYLKLKDNQQQLVQSEKMAGLGQLAAGVAHEINNPIGYIMSNLGTLSDYSESLIKVIQFIDDHLSEMKSDDLKNKFKKIYQDEDIDSILEDITDLIKESSDGTHRVKEIVQSLKSFARLDESEQKEADVNECIESTLKIANNEIKYKCEVIKDLTPLPPLKCFPGQLNQVIMNLLINAAQAIEKKGTITITTKATDKEIIICINDTGKGIAEADLPKLFDPFFTTKKQGEGTGLGLSIAHGIIQKHKGDITVKSLKDQGTTFTIRLPL